MKLSEILIVFIGVFVGVMFGLILLFVGLAIFLRYNIFAVSAIRRTSPFFFKRVIVPVSNLIPVEIAPGKLEMAASEQVRFTYYEDGVPQRDVIKVEGVSRIDKNTLEVIDIDGSKKKLMPADNGMVYVLNVGGDRLVLADWETIVRDFQPGDYWSLMKYTRDNDVIYFEKVFAYAGKVKQ